MNLGVIKIDGKVLQPRGHLIEPFPGLDLDPINNAGGRVFIFKVIELKPLTVFRLLLHWFLQVFIKKADRQDFPSPRKPLYPKVIVVGLGKLQVRISHKIFVLGEVLG